MILPPSQNTVGICNQITLLILYYISSRLVTLLKIKSLTFFNVLLVTSSSILAFRHSFFLFLKCLLASCLILFRLYTLLWLGSCNHSILACFLWSKKPKYSSSNQGLCCINSCRPRISLTEVLIFPLMFSQALKLWCGSVYEGGLKSSRPNNEKMNV